MTTPTDDGGIGGFNSYFAGGGGDGSSGPSPTLSGVDSFTGSSPVYVYWGTTQGEQIFGDRTDAFSGPGSGRATVADVTSPTEAVLRLLDWKRTNPEQFQKVVDQLYGHGLISSKDDWSQIVQAWSGAVDLAAQYYTGLGQKVTPLDAIGIMGSDPEAVKASRTQSGDLQPGQSQSQTSTSVNLSSGSEARGYANQAFRAYVGRDPSKKELAKWQAALHAAERSNPSVTTQTQAMNNAGEVNTSSTTTGGVDVGQLAEDQARSSKDYAGYQAYRLLDTFASILGPAVSL